MSSPYTNTKPESSKPSTLLKLSKLALYLVAACMAVAAITTTISFIRTMDDGKPQAPAFPHGTLEELLAPEAFIQAYLSVNCNATLLENTQTIRVSGVIDNGDVKQTFTLLKKRPDKILFKINSGAHKITFGVSDNTVWQVVRAPFIEDQTIRIEGEAATPWLEQRRFFDKIISASIGQGTISSITTSEWDSQTYLEVSTKSDTGQTSKTLIDPLTMHPKVELQEQPNGDIKQTVLSNYKNIQGMPIAFTMETFTEGTLESSIILDNAALNPGLLSRLFDVPDSLKTPTPPPNPEAH